MISAMPSPGEWFRRSACQTVAQASEPVKERPAAAAGPPGRAYPKPTRAKMRLTYDNCLGNNLCTIATNGLSLILPGNGGGYRLAEVRLQEGESLENALRRFKRKVQQEDIIKEIKKHSFYLKPGEKRRVKEALARKRSRKKARHEQD
jgi:small subunit ribosomal protein S21